MIEYKTQEMQMIPYKDRRKIEKKVLPEYYEGIRTHKKMFELRKDEDGIKPGDILVLREWDGEKYTGGMTRREVTAVLKDCPEYGLMDGYCILSLQTPGWDFVKPSAQPEYEPVTAKDFAKTMSENTLYGFMAWYGEALELMERQGFVICKKTM